METISPASPIFLVAARERILADNLPALWCYEQFSFHSQHEAQTRTEKWMRGFRPLSADGILPTLALGGELVMLTNEHTSRCLIKQSIMLTFTQLELLLVSAATMDAGSFKRIQGPDQGFTGRFFATVAFHVVKGMRKKREGVKRG